MKIPHIQLSGFLSIIVLHLTIRGDSPRSISRKPVRDMQPRNPPG